MRVSAHPSPVRAPLQQPPDERARLCLLSLSPVSLEPFPRRSLHANPREAGGWRANTPAIEKKKKKKSRRGGRCAEFSSLACCVVPLQAAPIFFPGATGLRALAQVRPQPPSPVGAWGEGLREPARNFCEVGGGDCRVSKPAANGPFPSRHS